MIKVAELFAGVGGFRLGLEGVTDEKGDTPFKVIWSNQWEPSTKRQHANEVYSYRFNGGAIHSESDIGEVLTDDIPDHDMLVGGFPCQDYSVATTLRSSKGLQGPKGILWWQIERILREKGDKKPKYLFLENVDRLLKSPASQRGRDFAILLASLADLGYFVEWRVINAADYGFPQRRRRVFILGYHSSTNIANSMRASGLKDWVDSEGIFQASFPATYQWNMDIVEKRIQGDLKRITETFNIEKSNSLSPFLTAGAMMDRQFVSCKYDANFNGPFETLADIIEPLSTIPEEYLVGHEVIPKWKAHKGAKRIEKVNKQGYKYTFSEGNMSFPDPIDKPSRTIITSEGGATPSRFKHIIEQEGQLRRLTPLELERLNGFPDNHTKLDGITDNKRAFFMGNALVVGVIQRIAHRLDKVLRNKIA